MEKLIQSFLNADLCLEMTSNFNYAFGFVVEIFELGKVENLDISTLGTNSSSDSGVNPPKIISIKIEV